MTRMLKIGDLQDMFGFSERQAKALLKTENFPVLKINTSYFVPEDKFLKWVEQTKEVHMKTT